MAHLPKCLSISQALVLQPEMVSFHSLKREKKGESRKRKERKERNRETEKRKKEKKKEKRKEKKKKRKKPQALPVDASQLQQLFAPFGLSCSLFLLLLFIIIYYCYLK